LSANPPPCVWHRRDTRPLGTTTTALRPFWLELYTRSPWSQKLIRGA